MSVSVPNGGRPAPKTGEPPVGARPNNSLANSASAPSAGPRPTTPQTSNSTMPAKPRYTLTAGTNISGANKGILPPTPGGAQAPPPISTTSNTTITSSVSAPASTAQPSKTPAGMLNMTGSGTHKGSTPNSPAVSIKGPEKVPVVGKVSSFSNSPTHTTDEPESPRRRKDTWKETTSLPTQSQRMSLQVQNSNLH